MNNDKKPKSEADKKRFYIGLYTCAGIMIAIAGIISAANLKSINNSAKKSEIQTKQQSELTDLKPVNNSKDESFKEKETQIKQNNTAETKENTENTKIESKTETTENKPIKQPETEPETTTNNSKTFSLFDESKEMSWPVNGQIVMDYSVETAIFDKTLEQYRTNDSICISAQAGTDVKAAAEGVVENIFEDNENGKSVVINHGNGWMTTYSQLENNLMVELGQVVGEGEVIGKVGKPTNYSVMLGDHLDFKITKNDASTDPKLVLAQYDE